MELWIVDRVEGDQVLLETPQKTLISVPAAAFGGCAQEGSVYRKDADGHFIALPEETKQRKKALFAAQEKILDKP